MTGRVARLLSGHAYLQASTLNGPFPESQPPDTFGACAGCTQLAYVSNPNVTNSNGTFTATLNAAVYSDPSNTFCAGCLDFFYQVTNSGGSTDDIGRVTAFNFTGFQVDAGYSVAGEPADGGTAFPTGTWAPGLVDRNTADTVGFQFANVATAIPPGGTSAVLVIETNATSFGSGTLVSPRWRHREFQCVRTDLFCQHSGTGFGAYVGPWDGSIGRSPALPFTAIDPSCAKRLKVLD